MIQFWSTKLKNQKIRLKEWYDAYLFRKYRKKALVPFDENWFRGKRVAIIGGADSAYKEKLGSYIDSYDLVVRINNGVRVIDKYKEYIGERTDFLFHTLYRKIEEGGSFIELDLWKEKNVKNIVFSHHLNSEYGIFLKEFVISDKGRERIIQFSESIYNSNMQTVFPIHPTTGVIAINTVSLCQPKEIYITGITFFKTAHFQDYRQGHLQHWLKLMSSSASQHNPEEEFQFFKKLYSVNKELFRLDSTLQQIIDND